MQFTALASSSRGNCYTLDDGHRRLLIECGIPIQRIHRGLNFKLSEIHACLLTHCHMDHAKAAKDIMRAGIDLWTSAETAEALGLSGHRLKVTEPLKTYQIGSWSVIGFPVQHDAPGALGFLLQSGTQKALFLTDSHFCRYRFPDLSLIIVECNWSKHTLSPDLDPIVKKRLIRSHMSLENLKRMLLANDLSKVREIFLIHLSDANSDADFFRDEVQKTTGKPTYVCSDNSALQLTNRKFR